MKTLNAVASLTDRVYSAILDEILDGVLPPGEHLVQEQLAAELGVSRQPIQQAMARLKADGLVEEIGTRGLRVSTLDLKRMRHHYDLRAVLDGYAARMAAERVRDGSGSQSKFARRARQILAAGTDAISGSLRDQIRHDEALHNLIYDWSGNPVLSDTAEPQWRFLRRAMADVLRHAEPPRAIWEQHAAIVDAIVAGDAEGAETLAQEHVRLAADLLIEALKKRDSSAGAATARATL